jgi:hypothetical protein
MDVDLSRLLEMHPHLPPTTSADCAHKAAVGLARHGYLPGVSLEIVFDDLRQQGVLCWSAVPDAGDNRLDFHRVTEDAAEAIALALVHVAKGWTVRRRAQREEHADWLLVDPDRQSVALEVSGVNLVDAGQRRLREKVEQVRRHQNPQAIKVACIVELARPRSRLRTA